MSSLTRSGHFLEDDQATQPALNPPSCDVKIEFKPCVKIAHSMFYHVPVTLNDDPELPNHAMRFVLLFHNVIITFLSSYISSTVIDRKVPMLNWCRSSNNPREEDTQSIVRLSVYLAIKNIIIIQKSVFLDVTF